MGDGLRPERALAVQKARLGRLAATDTVQWGTWTAMGTGTKNGHNNGK